MDNYDLVLEYLLSEGYSHKEATRIMVDEGWFQDLLGAAKKRFSSPKSIARAGVADVAATAIATTPQNTVRPALPPQPAPIVRQVAAPVTPNPLQQVAAPFKKVVNLARKVKSGGSVVPASKPGAVTPSTKPASGISNASSSSSVATRSGSSQVSTTGTSVRSPGGSLTKAGPVINVQPTLSGTPSVQRLSSGQVRNFKPSVKVSPTPAAVSGSTASNLIGALKYVPHVAAAAIGLNAGPVADGTLKGKDLNAFKPGPEQGVGVKPRVAAPYTPPRPPAPKTPEKKPEVQQVVTKKKVVPPVKQPERPKVDPEVQRYRELIKKGKRLEAETLGREIYQRTYGAPAFAPKKVA